MYKYELIFVSLGYRYILFDLILSAAKENLDKDLTEAEIWLHAGRKVKM